MKRPAPPSHLSAGWIEACEHCKMSRVDDTVLELHQTPDPCRNSAENTYSHDRSLDGYLASKWEKYDRQRGGSSVVSLQDTVVDPTAHLQASLFLSASLINDLLVAFGE
jgi:hypothetical protein